MNNDQYATILKMFTNLSEQIQVLRKDMNDGFTRVAEEFVEVRKEMADEFAKVRQEMKDEFANVRQEMADEFANVRQEMANGLAKQEAISGEILNAMNEPFAQLEKNTQKTKRKHERRLLKIEHHVGLA